VSWRGVTDVGTADGEKEWLGAESSGVFLSSAVSLFEGSLGDEAGTGDGEGSGVCDGARGGVEDGVTGADTGGRSWIGVGERMLARQTASKRIHDLWRMK